MKNYILRVKNSNGWVRVRSVQLTEEKYKNLFANLNKQVNGFTLLSIEQI
jgi:hypothetical protein